MVAGRGSRIALSIALSDNPLTQPLLDGSVSPQAVELLPTCVHPSEMFWRQLRYGDFDVSEMSLSSLMIAADRGDDRWIALPVFTMRRFFHTGVIVRRGCGIEQPADLAGKRVGVPEYQQTSAIWTRGILEEHFGLDLRSVEWFMERGPDRSHGAATGFVRPAGVRLNQIPARSSIGSMLISGELDATLLYLRGSNLVDRSSQDVDAVTEPLFKDALAEGQRYYRQSGLYPVNHAVVVKRELISRHPWLALNLYHAFIAAKEAARRVAAAVWRPWLELGKIDRAAADILDMDPLPFGVAAARGEIETISRYVHRQGLTDRQIGVEELLAPSTLAL
jgi:4,5-dihydroxyphthalate decarboxylase